MEESAKISMNWGGARTGAGRKKMDDKRVVLSLYVRPDIKARIMELAAAEGVKPGDLVTRWLESMQ